MKIRADIIVANENVAQVRGAILLVFITIYIIVTTIARDEDHSAREKQ
ncbi:MAG: hypothetical protein M5R36_11435 [Deltaproteobacteria bacterium]|nr:hypothetical protein [Deltaproteobacteria bacterium]